MKWQWSALADHITSNFLKAAVHKFCLIQVSSPIWNSEIKTCSKQKTFEKCCAQWMYPKNNDAGDLQAS